MSVETGPSGEPGDEPSEDIGAARISDPDDYVLRRRLQQLHDARDRVTETQRNAVRIETIDRGLTATQRNRLVFVDLLNYIRELKAILGQDSPERHDEFMTEVVIDGEGDGQTISGLLDRANDPPDTAVAMKAWEVCNEYLEEVAGAEIDSGLPEDTLQTCE
jgi:hypothetical protein